MKFKMGQKIKLKDYSGYGDYVEHRNEVGIILSIEKYGDLSIRIIWSDETESYIEKDNILPIETQITIK